MLQLHTENTEEHDVPIHGPGAFAWWYVDLVDAHGRGLVLIWSFGLPFLPGARSCPPARERPSLSLALYEDFRPTFYTLQQLAQDQVRIESPGCLRFGDSRLELVRRDGKVRLKAELSMQALGCGRIEGSVEAEGVACRTPGGDNQGSSTHRWAPILVAQPGRATLRMESGEGFDLVGRIYIDSNDSDRPLHALGIADWRWGRVALPDRELIYYLVEPQPGSDTAPIHHVLEARPDGSLRALAAEADFSAARRSLYGLAYHERLRLSGPQLDLQLHFRALVDDGPFYLRFLVDAEERHSGERGCGVAERVVPARVDLAWMRPFVRMRTQQARGRNSIWLPLFSGPRQGRLGRLARYWAGGHAGAGSRELL